MDFPSILYVYFVQMNFNYFPKCILLRLLHSSHAARFPMSLITIAQIYIIVYRCEIRDFDTLFNKKWKGSIPNQFNNTRNSEKTYTSGAGANCFLFWNSILCTYSFFWEGTKCSCQIRNVRKPWRERGQLGSVNVFERTNETMHHFPDWEGLK